MGAPCHVSLASTIVARVLDNISPHLMFVDGKAQYTAKAVVRGERWSLRKHPQGTEVKVRAEVVEVVDARLDVLESIRTNSLASLMHAGHYILKYASHSGRRTDRYLCYC